MALATVFMFSSGFADSDKINKKSDASFYECTYRITHHFLDGNNEPQSESRVYTRYANNRSHCGELYQSHLNQLNSGRLSFGLHP
jgi:hypothetical protein